MKEKWLILIGMAGLVGTVIIGGGLLKFGTELRDEIRNVRAALRLIQRQTNPTVEWRRRAIDPPSETNEHGAIPM